MMSKLKEMLKSSHIQMAIAAGVSILAIATFSGLVLHRAMNPMLLTIPVLIEVIYEGLIKKYKQAGFMKTWYWVCAILLSTASIMILHLV